MNRKNLDTLLKHVVKI